MNVRIGIWAGGDPSNARGTIECAGGETDYSNSPFTMYIKDVTIVNYNPAESYTWSDQSGSYESIEFTGSTGSTNSTSSTSSTTSKTTSASRSVSHPPRLLSLYLTVLNLVEALSPLLTQPRRPAPARFLLVPVSPLLLRFSMRLRA
jgi:hypothetical protein